VGRCCSSTCPDATRQMTFRDDYFTWPEMAAPRLISLASRAFVAKVEAPVESLLRRAERSLLSPRPIPNRVSAGSRGVDSRQPSSAHTS
jgi:hypothetical protein